MEVGELPVVGRGVSGQAVEAPQGRLCTVQRQGEVEVEWWLW